MRLNASLITCASLILSASAFSACSYDMPQIDTMNPESSSNSTGGFGGNGGMTASASTGGAGGTNTSVSSSSSAESSSSAMSSSSSSSSSSGGPTDVCGDGKIGTTEQCDDQNMRKGDGCDDVCHIENHDGCDGPMLDMGAEEVTIVSTTTNAQNNIGGSQPVEYCNVGRITTAPDVIYAINPQLNGTLRATLNADYYGHILHIRTMCSEMAPDIGCDDDWTPGTHDVSTVQVLMGKPVYVIVDSYAGNNGGFTLQLQLQ